MNLNLFKKNYILRRIHQSNHSKRQNKAQYHFFFPCHAASNNIQPKSNFPIIIIRQINQIKTQTTLEHKTNKPHFSLSTIASLKINQSREKNKDKIQKKSPETQLPRCDFRAKFPKISSSYNFEPRFCIKTLKI